MIQSEFKEAYIPAKKRTTVYFNNDQIEFMEKLTGRKQITRNQYISDLVNKEMTKKVNK